MSGTQPVLGLQPLDALELSNVVSDEDSVDCESVGGDQEIVAADWRACLLEFGADAAIVPICFWYKRKNLNSVEQLIYARGQPDDRRAAFGNAITDLIRNDDAVCERVAFDWRERVNFAGDLALRIFQEVGQDVGVEEILGGH